MNLRDAVSVDRPGFRARLTQQIEYSSVGRSFDDPQGLVPAVVDADLTIDRGEFNCFIGPSGSGKCTLMNMAACLLSPTRGALHIRVRTSAPSIPTLDTSRRRTPCFIADRGGQRRAAVGVARSQGAFHYDQCGVGCDPTTRSASGADTALDVPAPEAIQTRSRPRSSSRGRGEPGQKVQAREASAFRLAYA